VYAGGVSKQQTVEATQVGKQRVLRMAQDEEAHTLANFAGSIELETRERDVSTMRMQLAFMLYYNDSY
jgi:hypothetical protein